MAGRSKRRRNPHTRQILMNIIYIVLAAAVVAVAAMALMDRMYLFPLVFLLAAVLNFVDGIPRLHGSFRRNKKKWGGVALCVMGCLLLILSGVCALTLWK